MGRWSSLEGGESHCSLGQGHDVGELAGAEHPGVVPADGLLGLGQSVGVTTRRRVELVRLPGRVLVLPAVDAPTLRSRRLEQHSDVRYVEGFAWKNKINREK